MDTEIGSGQVSRREFLVNSSSLIAAGPVVGGMATGAEGKAPVPAPPDAASPARKIPIGLIDTVYYHLTLDEMLDKMSAQGIEAVEITTGGYGLPKHIPVEDILADPAKAKAWKKKFEDRNIRVGALNSSGNPIHPNPAMAKRYDQDFRQAILLAERLEIPVVVNFSGCPGDSPSAAHPNWVTYRWPPDYAELITWQWEKVVLPYWREAVKFARAHGVKKIAFEMHPGFVVYNPYTLVKLREAVGEEIGANCDLSHLFWQGCDPVEVIHFLGKQGAIFHAHMKDTVIFKHIADQTGVLNFSEDLAKSAQGSVMFRTVGYGHGAQVWKDVVKAYMDIGFQGILSIENEDSFMPGEVGIERAAFVLKNVRAELLEGK
ncbi:MAG: sugar phosphate isomerase/epimerase [Terriglobia bacterium]|jgi:sugar phosphate isomerase/epimerase